MEQGTLKPQKATARNGEGATPRVRDRLTQREHDHREKGEQREREGCRARCMHAEREQHGWREEPRWERGSL